MDRFLTNLSLEHEKEISKTPTRPSNSQLYKKSNQTKVQGILGRRFHDILLSENPPQINV